MIMKGDHPKTKIYFYGGAGGVTGANYILEIGNYRIMIDCGLFQGSRFAEEQNHEKFGFDASGVQTLFVTHAHVDHVGRIPKLYKEGFRGTIISTPPTRDLAEVMLTDAIKIMEHEVEDRGGTPLYTREDLNASLKLFTPVPYNKEIPLPGGVSVFLRDSAHILGSAMIEIHTENSKIVFTGDLGNTPAPLLNDIYPLEEVDYLSMESVYGNRFHESLATRKLTLERLIEDTVTTGGSIIIPAFALERSQALLSELNELVENHRIPRIPVFVDSPLAINATEVYKKYGSYFNEESQFAIKKGDDLFKFPGLTFTPTREASQKINDVKGQKIIIAGNPHGYGSRIMYHFLRYLPDPHSTIIFIGFPRVSSIGRRLMDGEKEVKIHGRMIPARARITNISSYSSHADQTQLKNFVARLKKPVKQIFVTMGEEEGSRIFARLIRDELGLQATVPKIGDVVELD
ncbi:MBL fold metallo-hydrolase [Candidatus Uhrbacteria bacterium]|nr:MBL fold metallo-hydrolase [Candidatus Uhrbacteria bacterium]